MMTAAITAVQGDFAEHKKALEKLGVGCIELRQKRDLEKPYDMLVLPGGESTTQGKILKELGMFDILKKQIEEGMPVLATCAGLILLAGKISNDDRKYFGTLPVTVQRNAYGRQLGSFHTLGSFAGLENIPMTFIRAPYIEKVSPDVDVFSEVDGKIVAVRYHRQLAMSFHPELDDDNRIYRLFLEKI